MIKDFISGAYHFAIEMAMSIPCHPFRRVVCKIVCKRFHTSSSVFRNVDFRSPYRVEIGSYTNINKRCVIDGRGG